MDILYQIKKRMLRTIFLPTPLRSFGANIKQFYIAYLIRKIDKPSSENQGFNNFNFLKRESSKI